MTKRRKPAPPPPEPTEEIPEVVKRTLRQTIAFFAGITAAVLLGLLVLIFIGGRMFVLSDAGRELVVSFIAGQKLGDYGRINVEGLKGDLWDDFTLEKVTVTDAEGVWLEAENVRVDWSYWRLIIRKFKASEISADVVRILREPLVEPSDDPPSDPPLDIDIDKISTRLELMEGFSKEYGRWNLTGSANIPRRGAKTAEVSAYSLTRPGDFLRAETTFGDDIDDFRLNALANEVQGGPLAGALGYSPDQPFNLRAVVNGEVIDAQVKTGDFIPLNLTGHYNKDGARISGYADFSRSDLLQPFVDRVGRTARFGLVSIPSRRDERFHTLAWDLRADNLTSKAVGRIDIEDQTAPDGIRVEVATPSLSRVLGTPVAGPSAYVGTFKGDAERWTMDGSVSLTGTDIASFRATRIAGPVDIRYNGGRFDLDAELGATGGAGEGVFGVLLGPTPFLRLEATRFKDGRVLLEKLDARGKALTLTGSGSTNLSGGLSFNGRAEITDARGLAPGAKGAFGGVIRASQSREREPWRLALDGRGRGLFTGQAELDRLLGRTPRLEIEGILTGADFAINRGALTGEAGQLNAKGLIGGKGDLRLAVDWTARGPFGVGPIEIDGAAKGDGAITGTLAQPRADLMADFDNIAAGPLKLRQTRMTLSFRQGTDSSDGRIVVDGASEWGPAHGEANFVLLPNGVRLDGVDLYAGGLDAEGSIALINNAPSSADLRFDARPGAFLASGSASGTIRLIEGAGNETAWVDVQGRNVRLTGSTYIIRTLDLEGRGTLERLPFTLKTDIGGDIPISFDGSGVFSRMETGQSLTLSGDGRIREIAFATRSPAVVAFAGDGKVIRFDLGVGGGVLLGEMRQDSRAAIIQADLTSVELGSLTPDLRGRATGRVSLRGAGSDLSGSANLTLEDVRSRDAPRGIAVDGTLNAQLLGDTLRIQANASDGDAVKASADLILPSVSSAVPLSIAIDRTRPMSGHVSIQGQVQPIWDVFFGGERSLAGNVDLEADLAGTMNEPRLNGRFDLADGRFSDSATGLRLEKVTLNTSFDDTWAQIERFSASDGDGGTAQGDGRLNLRLGGGSNFTLNLARFKVIDNDVATARASGPITVTRAATGNITLVGRLDVDEAEIAANPPGSNGIVRMDVVEINRPGGDPIEREEASSQRGPQIELDIQIRAPDDIFVEGRGLNVELSMDARVRGPMTAPTLTGEANIVRGEYEFAGKRFIFDDRGSITLSMDPARIRLDLRATREDPALTATVRVAGTAAKPEIILTSTPSLPQDEILSQVLFGRSASQLSGFEAAQLASGVAALAGGGGFDVLGNLREFAGLDRLSIGGEASALTIAGGRYLTDDVYLEIIGGGEGGAAVQVEWQVRRNVAVTSKFDGQGDASLSIRWRRSSRPPGSTDGDNRPNR